MPSARFPINVNLESIDGDVDRAKIVNGYAEVASAQEVKVYSRPALDLAQGSFAAFGQGIANTPDGKLFVVSGGEIYFPVPGGSFSASLSTTTNENELPVNFAYLNGTLHGVEQGTRGAVHHSVSPFTVWTTSGTVAAQGAQSHISYAGKLWAQSGTVVHTSANGTGWGTLANHPPLAGRLVGFKNALYCYPTGIGTNTSFYRTLDAGASAWGTLTANYSGTAITTARYASDFNRIVAMGGSRAAVSYDGTGWTNASNGMGFAFVDTHIDSFPAIVNGIVYAAGLGPTLYGSPNASDWARITGTYTALDASVVNVLEVPHIFTRNAGYGYDLYKLTGDGTLQGVSSVETLETTDGEVASIISTESGVSFIKTSTQAYTVSAEGLFTEVTDGQYPALTVRGAVYLNGRLYVMEPDGTIWNSAEDDFTSWAGTDFVTAEFEADEGVCLAKQGEYVIALGQFTTEAFYDAGNATGSPLDPVGSAVMLIGCAHANSVAQVETSLVWVAQQKGQGSTFHKGRFVAFMTGYGAYDRISTPDVERVLDKDAFNEVYADILTIAGHVFYVLSLADSDISLVYDFRSKLWYQWSLLTQGSAKSVSALTQTSGVATATSTAHGFSDGDQVTIAGADQAGYNLTVNVNRVDANTFTYPVAAATVSPATGTITATGWTEGALDISASCYFDNSQLVQLRETGDVYVLDVTGTDDDGAPIDFRIRTRLWDAGTGREKFQNGLEVQGDKVSSTGLVRYWNEDFNTSTIFKRVDLSLKRPRVRRGGTFSRRAVEFRHTLSAKVGITALEADIEMGEQ